MSRRALFLAVGGAAGLNLVAAPAVVAAGATVGGRTLVWSAKGTATHRAGEALWSLGDDGRVRQETPILIATRRSSAEYVGKVSYTGDVAAEGGGGSARAYVTACRAVYTGPAGRSRAYQARHTAPGRCDVFSGPVPSAHVLTRDPASAVGWDETAVAAAPGWLAIARKEPGASDVIVLHNGVRVARYGGRSATTADARGSVAGHELFVGSDGTTWFRWLRPDAAGACGTQPPDVALGDRLRESLIVRIDPASMQSRVVARRCASLNAADGALGGLRLAAIGRGPFLGSYACSVLLDAAGAPQRVGATPTETATQQDDVLKGPVGGQALYTVDSTDNINVTQWYPTDPSLRSLALRPWFGQPIAPTPTTPLAAATPTLQNCANALVNNQPLPAP